VRTVTGMLDGVANILVHPIPGTNSSVIQMANDGSGSMYIGRTNSSGNTNVFNFGPAGGFVPIPNYINFVGSSGSLPLAFVTSSIERMRISSSGNVGIGLTNPTEKLDVNGTARASNIKVQDWTLSSPTEGLLQGLYYLTFTDPLNKVLATLRRSSSSVDDYRFGIGTNEPGTTFDVLQTGNTGRTVARIRASDTGVDSNNTLLELSFPEDPTCNGAYFIKFTDADGEIGFIKATNNGVSFSSLSDYRLKTNIQPLTGAVERVLNMKPCTFNWLRNGVSSEGFIAHELQEVVPEAVTGIKDEVNDEGNIVPQGVDTRYIVPVLTAALQEALKRIGELETKVAKLKTK